MRDVFALEQVFDFAHFEFALGKAGVAAVGLAFVADGGQPVRVDGQAEQFVFVLAQGGGQLQAFHVVFGQRVVGCADAELHGHVQAGWGFAATRDTHQNQVSLVVFVCTGAVIVVEGKVHRFDTLHVVGVVADGVRFADRVRRVFGQLLFQWGEEAGEDVDHETIGGREDFANVLIDDGVEDYRTNSVFFGGVIDLLYHCPRFIGAVYIRPRELAEGHIFELGQQTLAEGFGGDAGAIGDKESRSFHLRLGP